MIDLWTDKFDVSNPAERAADIIQEYLSQGHATINLSMEGPSASHIGIYKLLDYVCEKFAFDKSKISIVTSNLEEVHSEYDIVYQQAWHLDKFVKNAKTKNWTRDRFVDKNIGENLFACFYNIPAWDRVCLLSHIKFNTKNQSILSCNGVVEGNRYNSYSLDKILYYCPNELDNIVQLINSGIGPLSDHPSPGLNGKPDPNDQLDVITYYDKIFVDVVGETYIHGLTFYPTEKTWRPIFSLTPFIISGPQGFLSNLKARYNLKTFSQWWDESYDDYQNYDRIKRMYQIIDFLDSLSISEQQAMYQEMIPTLEHNRSIIFKDLK